MLGLMLEHHPHGPLADLCWVLASSCHRPILSDVGASNIPGAVHILGAPGFVNQPFLDLFAGAIPAVTPLIVKS